MTQRNTQNRSQILAGLIVPLVLGLGLYLLLALLIDREVITNELLLRYLTGHPISKITTFMFCVGTAALLLIANNVFDQFCICNKIRLSDNQDADSTADEQLPPPVETLLDHLNGYRRSWRSQYLWQRLSSALQFIHRTGGPCGIEDELKYLSDIDHERQQRRYSLVRIVIWATPMLGFLGTVLGISQALGGIQVGPDNDFQQMLNSLRGSLFVAFDTTALALTLSILMMFFQFVVDRFELQLLDVVDQRAREELSPIYQGDAFLDPQTKAMERMGRSVMETSEQLVSQQTELWQKSVQSAETAWTDTISNISESVRSSLEETMKVAVKELADSIARGVDIADESMSKRWEQWQVTLSENARLLNDQQQNMLAQAELVQNLLTKIESTNNAQQLLNQNLDALAATARLHTTLDRLSESIIELKRHSGSGNIPSATGLRIADRNASGARRAGKGEPTYRVNREAA